MSRLLRDALSPKKVNLLLKDEEEIGTSSIEHGRYINARNAQTLNAVKESP